MCCIYRTLEQTMEDYVTDWFEGYVHANGIDIHYHRTGGSGKPAIVLLHGLTDNGLCWTRVARDLQEGYDVVIPDARGHGQTGGPVEGISISLLADDAAALISALGLERPYLFGHSMGAITAMFVAANYPGLVRAIVLEDPPLRETDPDIDARVQGALTAGPQAREEWVAQAHRDNPRWVDEEVYPWADSRFQFDPGVMRIDFGQPWRNLMSAIKCPVLLVTGEVGLGGLVTPEHVQEAMQISPDVEVAHIRDAGHCIHRDQYNETLEPVLDFLRRNR